MTEGDPVQIEITDELDLHTFQPREVGELLVDYLGECQKRGILNVRVIHGKGTGALRVGVHEKLAKMEIVAAITWPASAQTGGWGATWVQLKAL
jgi:DNA-nicking Smr family endonuclease